MTLSLAALFGLVQGITEFLPVSSTAHLRIVAALTARGDQGMPAFTAVIQLGSLVAVMGYFVRDLARMSRSLVTLRWSPDAQLALCIVVGTVPIGVAGLGLKGFITGEARSLWVVASALVAVAVAMWAAERMAGQRRGLADLRLVDALIIGGAQACALVPGVSRSGATLVAALLIGLRRDDGARMSFLLSVPAIAAAGLFELKDGAGELAAIGAAPVLVATGVAVLASYASIAWLMRYLRTRTLLPFAAYRVILGAVLLAMVAGGVLTP